MSATTAPAPVFDTARLRLRNEAPVGHGPVIYWMQRDQRVMDNWALVYAQTEAQARGVGVIVIFNLVPRFGETTQRHYDFMLRGLREVSETCASLNIPFVMLQGAPTETIPAFVAKYGVGEVVVDFNPLRFTDAWRREVGEALPVRLTEVDAHNIVPCWVASPKQEFAAHTFRPKVTKHYRQFAGSIPGITAHPYTAAVESSEVDWEALRTASSIDDSVPAVDWITPGPTAAAEQLQRFITEHLDTYATKRNDPNEAALSDLSPYLHFGQISAQRVATEVLAASADSESRDAFFEELVVRRELTDNFCFYNQQYDTVSGAHEWAQKTLAAHRDDPREHIYTRAEFESAQTHDPLWNAAQMQMVREGKMHGFMRMYWAKKILEWTNTPEYAIEVALYLNDRYELDGTDPNGVVGVMWSIAGVHDRAWTERPVFGKIRYMNYNGCKRKFDVASYIARYTEPDPDLFDHD